MHASRAALCLALLSSSALAQEALFSSNGNARGGQLGHDVATAGDVNLDGFVDVIAGAPLDDTVGANAGRANVYSGKDGSLLVGMTGQLGEEFGYAVSGIADFDGDGH